MERKCKVIVEKVDGKRETCNGTITFWKEIIESRTHRKLLIYKCKECGLLYGSLEKGI